MPIKPRINFKTINFILKGYFALLDTEFSLKPEVFELKYYT